MPTVYRVLIVGLGTAGRGFAQIVHEHGARIAKQTGADIRIVGVVTASRGSAYDANGLDLGAVLAAKTLHSMPSAVAEDALTMITTRSADIMVELTPTNLDSGEPATSHIRAALERGMHVITANKGPAALHLTALRALALKRGCSWGSKAPSWPEPRHCDWDGVAWLGQILAASEALSTEPPTIS